MTPRRILLAAPLVALALPARASAPSIEAFRDPGCGCCEGWAEHLRAAGFRVTMTDHRDLPSLRRGAGVPEDLAGCHFARMGPYVLEGHVPAAAVRRFLAAPGGWRGLAVPGMPMGSPGMEMPGHAPETYAIVAFGRAGRDPGWATARGDALL